MKTTPTKVAGTKAVDAIALLVADHQAIKALFKEFKTIQGKGDSDESKVQLVDQICDELSVHTQIEEEIFYPAAREVIDDDDLADEALVEHASARELIAQLREMSPEDDLYDAKVTVLSEYIDHHVKAEEGEMFPKARKADLDTGSLGQEMELRKEELKGDIPARATVPSSPARVKAPNGSKRSSRPPG